MIKAPVPALKELQRRLSAILYTVHVPRPSAHGFLPERGIVTNASVHVGKRFVGNVDLEDFFGTINFGRVRGLFLAAPYGLPKPVATTLAQICCHDNALPQGAPTSPIVSNMIAIALDRELGRLAYAHSCLYTRYADDLTFSCEERVFPAEILERRPDGTIAVGTELAVALQRQGFRPNPAKVRLADRHARQEVTGLIVNQKVNIRREFIRQLRAMIHAIERYGEARATQEHYTRYADSRRQALLSSMRPPLSTIIEGKLEFVRNTLGRDSPVYLNLWQRYCNAHDHRKNVESRRDDFFYDDDYLDDIIGNFDADEQPEPEPTRRETPPVPATRTRKPRALLSAETRQPRRHYDRQLRQRAVQRVISEGFSIQEAASQFAIPSPLLRTWVLQTRFAISNGFREPPSNAEQEKPGLVERFAAFFNRPTKQ